MVLDRQQHDELRSLLPVYALGAVDATECAAIEAHLGECRDCRHAAIDNLHAASLLVDERLQVPPALWDSIVGRIGGALSPEVPTRGRGRAGSD